MSLSRIPRSIATRVRSGRAWTARWRRWAGFRALRRRTPKWIPRGRPDGNGKRLGERKLAPERAAAAAPAGGGVRRRRARVPGDRAGSSAGGAGSRRDGRDVGAVARGGRGAGGAVLRRRGVHGLPAPGARQIGRAHV